jgi:hypothetical protein
MRKVLFLSVLILIAGSSWAQELKKFSMDEPAAGFGAVNDPAVKAEGKGSLRIFTPGPSTICLGQLDLDGAKAENAALVYRARLKSELEGSAYLEMWVTVDGKSYFSKGLPTAVEGHRDWAEARAPFYLQKGQRATQAVFNLVINGKGTVWVDDAALSLEPLPAQTARP